MADVPSPVRVIIHWAKHAQYAVTGQPVRTQDGTLETFPDIEECDVCTAVLVGQTYPEPEQLVDAATNIFARLNARHKEIHGG